MALTLAMPSLIEVWRPSTSAIAPSSTWPYSSSCPPTNPSTGLCPLSTTFPCGPDTATASTGTPPGVLVSKAYDLVVVVDHHTLAEDAEDGARRRGRGRGGGIGRGRGGMDAEGGSAAHRHRNRAGGHHRNLIGRFRRGFYFFSSYKKCRCSLLDWAGLGSILQITAMVYPDPWSLGTAACGTRTWAAPWLAERRTARRD